MIKDKPIKEIVLKEAELYEYKGADQVVPASVIAETLSHSKDAIFKFKTGIPSMDRILDGVECGELILVTGLPGDGKCLGKGTPVIMYDGSIKNVEDIVNGDKLMGVDSTPRIVSGVITGKDTLYKVNQVKGDSYVVNSEHILSLKKTGTNEIINIPIKEYLENSKSTMFRLKGWKTGVNFKELNYQ